MQRLGAKAIALLLLSAWACAGEPRSTPSGVHDGGQADVGAVDVDAGEVDAGEVDAGQAEAICAAFGACETDPAGTTWSAVARCEDPLEAAIEVQCAGAEVLTRSSTTTGSLRFEASTFQLSVVDATTYVVRYPASCTHLLGGCEQYGQVLVNLGFDGAACAAEAESCRCMLPTNLSYAKSGTWQQDQGGLSGAFDDGGDFAGCATAERLEFVVSYPDEATDRLVWAP